jgi:hypothetical protein
MATSDASVFQLTEEEKFTQVLEYLGSATVVESRGHRVARVEVNDLAKLATRLYLANPRADHLLAFLNQVETKEAAEVVEYLNFTQMSFTVIGRLGVPQVIPPLGRIKPDEEQAGHFVVRRSILLNTTPAIEAAYAHLALLGGEANTPEERVLMRQQMTNTSRGICNVYSIEHFFHPREVIKEAFAYDDATDLVIGVSEKMEGKKIFHPSHPSKRREHYDNQIKEVVKSADHRLGIRFVSKSQRPLYVKAFGKVLRLTGKPGMPIHRTKANQQKSERLEEYIEVSVVAGGDGLPESSTTHFTLAEARGLFGVFETEEQAFEHGDYHKVTEKSLAEQEAKFKQELAAKLALETANHKRMIDDLNAKHERELKDLAHQQELELKRKVAEMEEQHRQKEFTHKNKESDLKMKEAEVKHTYEVRHTETKIFSDAVKFGIAAVTGLVTVGIAIWKWCF